MQLRYGFMSHLLVSLDLQGAVSYYGGSCVDSLLSHPGNC